MVQLIWILPIVYGKFTKIKNKNGGTAMERIGRKNQTFIIEIKGTENQSWQGCITWMDTNKKECFRSALEMIKLIDSTLNENEEV